MTYHERLLKAAKEACDKLFSDRTVSPSECRDSLRDVKEHIEMKIAALEVDKE